MIEIKDKKDCCGCWACQNACPKHCISMVEDNEGFRYPQIDKALCVDCGMCDKVCPVKNVEPDKPFEQQAVLFQHSDAEILRQSTSGGLFTAIASWIIEKGGVVYGAGYSDSDVRIINHFYVDNDLDLRKFRNSKYAQSNIGDTFKECKQFLKTGRYVLYSGTPCQLEGLRKFLGNDFDNLITVDVVCHACPSPLVYRKFVDYQCSLANKIAYDVKFRDKVYGYKYSAMTIYEPSSAKPFYKEGIDTDIMLRSFFANISPRPSCFSCKFKKRYRITDFTIWDCFDVEKFSQSLDNDKGVTRALLHSEKSRTIWNEIRNSGKSLEISADEAVAGLMEMFQSVPMNPLRNDFFHDLNTLSTEEVFAKYFPLTLRHRLEKQARLWSNRLGIYKLAKKIFKKLHGKGEIKR